MKSKDFQNGLILGMVSGGVVEVEDTTELDSLEDLIDQSGVLDSTEGSVEEKVEQLIYKTNLMNNTTALAFAGSKIKEITYDCSTVKNLANAFQVCNDLTEIHLSNTNKVESWNYAFASRYIETIDILDFSGATAINYQTLGQCPALVNLKFVPNTLKKSLHLGASLLLSAESIQSIIDGLATVETAQTLTLHKDIVLTDEQKATINAKGWTLAQ